MAWRVDERSRRLAHINLGTIGFAKNRELRSNTNYIAYIKILAIYFAEWRLDGAKIAVIYR
jgi:hypothetical protein